MGNRRGRSGLGVAGVTRDVGLERGAGAPTICTDPNCHAAAEWEIGTTLKARACSLHRAMWDTACEREGMRAPRWRQLDGQTVALAVVVIAFLLAPGCGPRNHEEGGLWIGALVGIAAVLLVAYVVVADVVQAFRDRGDR